MSESTHPDLGSRKPGSCCNTYASQSQLLNLIHPPDLLYGPDPYDINFCFPFLPAALCNEDIGVKLAPFVPRLHAETFFQHAVQHPEDFQYTRFPIPKTLEDMLAFLESRTRRNPANMAFAILFRDKAGHWVSGGFIMLVSCNPETLSAEIATGILFDEFRGKSRAAGPIALILRYCFNTPTDEVAGLGLRKVGWIAEANNYASQAVALNMGLRLESMRRWNRIVPGKKGNGKTLRKGDPLGTPGTDDFFFTMCWDDWEAYGRRLAESVFANTYKAKL